MALQNSWPGPTGVTSTTAARKNLAGILETDSSGSPRAGVFPSNSNALVTARADMNVDIAAFQGVAVQFGGPILLSNDGVIQLPAPLVSGAGTNYYVIYVKQNESVSPGTDANNNVVAGVTVSTSSFAVARAALPAGALELATVQMPTGKTATNASGVTITQTHLYTAMEGACVLIRNQAEQDAWTPSDGSLAYRLDTTLPMIRVGGVWRPNGEVLYSIPGAVLSGSIPPAGTRVFRQAGVVSVTTNAFGDVGVNYPTPFPNGVISATIHRHSFAVFGPTFEVLNAVQTLSSLTWRVYSSTGGAAGPGGTFMYTYEAIGW